MEEKVCTGVAAIAARKRHAALGQPFGKPVVVVRRAREFFLLGALGLDLAGAVTITPADGEAWPPDAHAGADRDRDEDHRGENALRFSLAGVKLVFSAVKEAAGGPTIPARGVGGSWIVKLPSGQFAGVPENEFSMMTLARLAGINVPALRLVELGVQSVRPGCFELHVLRTLAELVHREHEIARNLGVVGAEEKVNPEVAAGEQGE